MTDSDEQRQRRERIAARYAARVANREARATLPTLARAVTEEVTGVNNPSGIGYRGNCLSCRWVDITWNTRRQATFRTLDHNHERHGLGD